MAVLAVSRINATGVSRINATGTVFNIGAQGTNLCIDVPGAPSDSAVLLKTCNGGSTQQWYFDGGAWKMQNALEPDKCIDAGDMSQGTPVMLWHCNGYNQQVWGYDSSMGTIYLAKSTTDASICLDSTEKPADGSAVIVWGCNGLQDQKFFIKPAAGISVDESP